MLLKRRPLPNPIRLTEDDERDPGGEVPGVAEGGVVREALEGAAVVGGRGAELDVAAHLLAAVRRRAELGPVGVPRLPGLRPAEERPRPGRLCGMTERRGMTNMLVWLNTGIANN